MAVESTTEAIVVNDAVLSMLQLLLLLLPASRPRPQPDEINHDLFCGVSLALAA